MQFLFILICSIMSCIKVTTQGYIAKENVRNTKDSVFANCVVFAFTAIIFSVSLRNKFDWNIIYYALFFGIFSSSFQIFYALALEAGPFSATCMTINFSMIVPIIFSLIFLGEKLTVAKVIGMSLCLFALFLNSRSDGRKINIKWIFYLLMAFFSTGAGISITQKLFAKSPYASQIEQFVFLGYIFAFLITFIVVLIQNKTQEKRNFSLSRKNVLLIVIIAACLGIYQYFKTFADSFVDAIVLNPSISGLATTLQMLSGRIIFKEKFTIRQIISMCIGISAILMMSI